MKYLYLLIQHLFPRRQWTILREVQVFDQFSGDRPVYTIIVQCDQFGNLREFKVK